MPDELRPNLAYWQQSSHLATPSQREPTAPPPAAAPVPAPPPAQALPREEEEAPIAPKARKQKRESTVALYCRVPESLQRNLKLRAVAEGSTIAELVVELLSESVGSWSAPYRRNQKAG